MINKHRVLQTILITALVAVNGFAYGQTMQWAKTLAGANYEASRSIANDQFGNVYTTGMFQTMTDFDPGSGTYFLTGAGNSDIYISKLDSSGNFLWAKSFGDWANDWGQSIVVDAQGNSYTTGTFNDTVDFDPGAGVFNLIANPINDIFITKLDPSGNLIWAKAIGGINYDEPYAIDLDASGNVYTTGRFQSTTDFDPNIGIFNLSSNGSFDNFVFKLDSSGNFVWAKSFGGLYAERSKYLKLDKYANVIIAGVFGSTMDFDPGIGTYILNPTSVTSGDIFVLKLDSAGNFIWVKPMGGTPLEEPYSLDIDSLGNIYTIGQFQGTVDFDPDTTTFNLTATSTYDIFISKLDSSGGFQWADAFHGLNFNFNSGNTITTDFAGNIYVAGQFGGTMDFDPGPAVFNLTSVGDIDVFICKLNAAGNFLWAFNIGSPYQENCYGLSIDNWGNLYATGIYAGTIDFDPGPNIFNLISQNSSQDIFIMKLGDLTTDIPTANTRSQTPIFIYPNPATASITVKWNHDLVKIEQIIIYDLFGRVIFKNTICNPQSDFTIDISSLSPGTYFIKAENAVKRFVKE